MRYGSVMVDLAEHMAGRGVPVATTGLCHPTILDEPDTCGRRVVVIEHDLTVLRAADWIVDLGPEGGAGGGRIVAQGTPTAAADRPDSHTGRQLRTRSEPPAPPRPRSGSSGTTARS